MSSSDRPDRYWVIPFEAFSAHFLSLDAVAVAVVAADLNVANRVTRLGDIWKFLVKKFLSKVAQIFGDFLAYFESSIF